MKYNLKYQQFIYAAIVCMQLTLVGCSSGGSGSGLGNVSSNYPHLTSTPQVSYIQNIYDMTQYDVTVNLQADGPDGVFSVSLWMHSKDDASVFTHMDLQFMGGTTWSATTNPYLSLPAGNYYIDSIIVEDADPFLGGLVKSSWYEIGFFSNSHYDIDQRLTDWSNVNILEFNFAVSNIPVVNFTLP